MRGMADSMALYVQPLLEDSDHSQEQIQKAYSIGQICWNLALLPKDAREKSIGTMQSTMGMDQVEFDDFRSSVIEPMIKRHWDLFPSLSQNTAEKRSSLVSRANKRYNKTGRNEPCPCESGKKYKRCCGK